MKVVMFGTVASTRPTAALERSRMAQLYVTVRASEQGTAILTITVDAENHITVESIERLPAGLAPAVAWLRERFPGLPTIGDATLIVDTDGFGSALVDTLGVRSRSHVILFGKRGRERQELVDALLVAEQERRIHFEPSRHGDAMRRALLGYRRQVGDDGVLQGGELVVALALAAVNPRRSVPRIF